MELGNFCNLFVWTFLHILFIPIIFSGLCGVGGLYGASMLAMTVYVCHSSPAKNPLTNKFHALGLD